MCTEDMLYLDESVLHNELKGSSVDVGSTLWKGMGESVSVSRTDLSHPDRFQWHSSTWRFSTLKEAQLAA